MTGGAPAAAAARGSGAAAVREFERSGGGFLLRLTRNTVPAGNPTVFFRNHDVSDQNLWIESRGGVAVRISDTVGENDGASRTLPVTAGAWHLFCALADHDTMTRTLTVTP